MITLYQFEISPFCDKVRRILNVKRVPYTIEEVPPSKTLSVVRKLNPSGKLPFLRDESGHVVADSTDIAYWLEERYPEPKLVPDDPRERALCHVLEDWADESLYFYEMRLRFTLPHNARRFIPELVKYERSLVQKLAPLAMPIVLRRTVAAQGVGKKPLAVVLGDVERHLDAIAGLLSGGNDWLVGDRMTLADVSVFAQLFCIRASDEGGRMVTARPAVAAWMARVAGSTGPLVDDHSPGQAAAMGRR
jgi:glutathione S-transferase